MAAAVTGWSPVIMMARTPARRASATAARASGRGGSIIPTTPSQTSPCSTSSVSSPESASRAEGPVGDAERPQRRGAQRVDGAQDLLPALPG